jgi:ferredoxin
LERIQLRMVSIMVKIDEDECIGCESCVELCPEIFGFDADSAKAYVITPEGGDQACIDEAIGSCPAECITND